MKIEQIYNEWILSVSEFGVNDDAVISITIECILIKERLQLAIKNKTEVSLGKEMNLLNNFHFVQKLDNQC